MDIEKYIGKEFNGTFQRTHEDILASRMHREKLKKERPDILEDYDRIHGSSDTEDKKDCRPFNFSLWIDTYEPKSRRFLGRMKDFFGNSELAGKIDYQKIEFKKNYVGEKPPEAIEWSRYRDCKFVGEITEISENIHIEGTYDPFPDAGHKGVWSMDLRVK